MTIRAPIPALLLAAGILLAQEPRPFEDEEIQRLLDRFDQSRENRPLPEITVVNTLNELAAAYAYLATGGDRLTNVQKKLKEAIVVRLTKELSAKKRPIVSIHSAKLLGEMGDPKGAAPLLAWVEGLLKEAHPNPTAVEYGFRSLAWIGSPATLERTLGCATGTHDDDSVITAAIKACSEWRELDGESRKLLFDRICGYLEQIQGPNQRYEAVEKDGLKALSELAGGKERFGGPGEAREWSAKNTKWEPYVGPRFRK